MPLPSLPRQRPIQGLHKDWKFGKKNPKWPEAARTTGFASLTDPRIAEILGKIGRGSEQEALAKRVVALEQYYPQATLPELIAIDYLKQKSVEFYFQELVAGGRNVKGGRVLDIVIPMGAQALVINVQGEYYHPSAQVETMTRVIIMSSIIAGMKPWAYVEVWEDDIYMDQKRVMDSALAGIQLHRKEQ